MSYDDMRDRIDALEYAMSAIDDAIYALKQLGDDAGCDIDAMRDMMRGYEIERDELEASCRAIDDEEDYALEREYYGSVI